MVARPISISLKLALVFAFFAAGLLAAVGSLAYFSGRASLEAATTANLLSTAVEKEANLNNWVAERRSDIHTVASSPALSRLLASFTTAASGSDAAADLHDQIVAELRLRTGTGQPFTEIFFMDPASGQVLIGTDPAEEDKFREDRLYFVQGRLGPYFEELHYSFDSRGPAMVASAPVQALDGRLLGVLAGRLNQDAVTAIVNRRSGLYQTEDSYLVNRAKLYATQPRFLSDPAVLLRGAQSEPVQRCLAGGSGDMQDSDYRGVLVISVYRWVPELGLCLITKFDQSEAIAPARAFGQRLLLIGALALAAASALAVAVARTITRPVLALQAGAARLGRGELEFRLSARSRDELGALAREFNGMAAAIADKEQQLRTYAGQLEQRVRDRTAALEQANRDLQREVEERKRAEALLARQAEELRRSNAELEQFAYVASHDLQEPLRAVAGTVRLLQQRYQGQLDGRADEFIQHAVDGATRMQTLIDDLLAFSRIGTRGKPFETANAEAILARALANLSVAIQESGAAVTHGPLPTVLADGVQLGQVLQNLISNAIKFRQEGGSPKVHVAARCDQGEWIFSVRDNGIGLEPQYSERIFGVFQRLHTRREYPGTGIGLAICKKIVERHDGRIWVESQLGEGSTFYFTLPDRR